MKIKYSTLALLSIIVPVLGACSDRKSSVPYILVPGLSGVDLTFCPGPQLLVANGGRELTQINGMGGRLQIPLDAPVQRIACDASGGFITAGTDGKTRYYSAHSRESTAYGPEHTTDVAVSCNTENEVQYLIAQDTGVEQWDPKTQNRTLWPHTHGASRLTHMDCGQVLVWTAQEIALVTQDSRRVLLSGLTNITAVAWDYQQSGYLVHHQPPRLSRFDLQGQLKDITVLPEGARAIHAGTGGSFKTNQMFILEPGALSYADVTKPPTRSQAPNDHNPRE